MSRMNSPLDEPVRQPASERVSFDLPATASTIVSGTAAQRPGVLMQVMLRCGCLLWLLAIQTQGVMGQDVSRQFSEAEVEWFEREVRPIFAEHCSSCHSQSVGTCKGGLSLETREAILAGGDSGPAIVVGKPEASLLVEAIRRESFEMPPEKPLTADAQATLIRWIERGAPWSVTQPSREDESTDWLQQRFSQHWAWSPVGDARVPEFAQDEWSRRPLDRFVLDGLHKLKIEPAGDTNDQVLVRRLSYDLLGLPPSPELVQLAQDGLDEVAYAGIVDRMLASPQFGVHWGRHWLDLVRYAETLGHEFDFPARHAWRYRDAVVNAFNADVPYRVFVQEHLAGDQVAAPRTDPLTGVNESLALTGWWWLGDSVHAPVDVTNDWATRVDNQIDVFSKTFLGMTIACARCHDHKFDAVRQADYYALAGVIESSRRTYAVTDPDSRIAEHVQQLSSQVEAADRLANDKWASTATTDGLRGWLHELVDRAADLDAKQIEAAFPVSSPLFPLRVLLDERTFATAIDDYRARLQRASADFEDWYVKSEPFADFSKGLPEGWKIEAASDSYRSGAAFDWFTAALPLPAKSDVFSSHGLGAMRHVTLRSPTFSVSRKAICVKGRGSGARSHVVVSNYFMQEFHDLLFGDLRKTFAASQDGSWLTHRGDLNKYIGHEAFLEFEDDGESWFEIAEIRFADSAPANPQPHQLAMHLFRFPALDSNEFFEHLVERFGQEWNIGTIDVRRAVVLASLELDMAPPIADTSALRQQAERLQSLDAQAPPPVRLLAITEGTPRDTAIALRGDPHRRGTFVPRGCLDATLAARPIAETSSGRAELAQRLLSDRHPLTARVMVNRVWMHLLGQGLVTSPDNFGVLGGRPSHPALLDYLSQAFVDQDWSVKWLVREIVLSRVYRLSVEASPELRTVDPNATWLSHRRVRRLPAEAIRDALLSTADSLDLQLSGPSVPVYLSDQMTGRGRPSTSGPLDGAHRRSLYVEVRRNFLNPFLLAFDFPLPSTTVGQRNVSNVPAQALGMLNDPLIADVSADWVLGLAPISVPRERIEAMFVAAYGRRPTAEQLDECLEFIAAGAEPTVWLELAHVLINSKEFIYLQ